MIPLSWSFSVDNIPSENFLYKPMSAYTKTGRMYNYLYKDPRIAEYQEQVIKNLDLLIKTEDIPMPENTFGFINEFRLSFNSERYWSLDITNCIKPLEDAYMRFFKSRGREFDDSQLVANLEVKITVSEDTKNFISCTTYFLDSSDEIDYLYRHQFVKLFFK